MRWRFCWKEGARTRYKTTRTREEAEFLADEMLREMEAGGLVWSGLAEGRRRFLEEVNRLARPDEEEAVIGFLRARAKSGDLAAAVGRFLDHKEAAAGEETRHLRNVRRDLEAMVERFPDALCADVHAPELLAWWTERNEGKSRKTALECRGNLLAFWRWAQVDGSAPAGTPPPEKLPRYELGKQERRVLSVAELEACMREVRPEFRAWLVLGAFAGLRPEEIAPPKKKGMSKAGKRGLLAEEIDWDFRVIRVAAETAKTGQPRIVPMCDALVEGLEWAGIRKGMVGAVQGINASEGDETTRLGKVVFGGKWPQDALRHSFGSMRAALVRSLDQVAMEMGTSVAMLQKHYHNPRTMDEAEAWFGVRPFRFDPMRKRSRGGNSQTSASSMAG